ncbi:phage baseplate assembly protein [Bradyrhizobium sp. Ec3.3]|uniref:phage baseplate assembly protein domain-containing protein n=1 Tax=Bradyrhizobium sp. Ec3.3 TaxID=189753 RepID=UPI0018DE1638|nr:phage baseplate assembly protein [Bradyrhizobium sp. Ec3.3]
MKVDDSRSQQRIDLKGLKNEKPKKIWRPLDFGFTSVPPQDCDGYLIQMGSRSDRTLYLDGGHEKYRPKNTPAGCMAIFNQYGDIVRVFKDNADVVHQKKVNIRIGHGYKAGESGDSGNASTDIDDQSSEDTKTISVVLEDGEAITLTYEGSTVTIREDGHIVAQAASQFSGGVAGGRWVVVRGSRVDLGVTSPDGTATPQVETTAGPSNIVFAEIA